MKKIDVSNFNNNSGLYALAVAVARAIENKQGIGLIPAYIRQVVKSRLHNKLLNVEELGELLRKALMEAMQHDSAFQDLSLYQIINYCLDKTDTEFNIVVCNKAIIKAIKDRSNSIRFAHPVSIDSLSSEEEFASFKQDISLVINSNDEPTYSSLEEVFKSDIDLDAFCKLCFFTAKYFSHDLLSPIQKVIFEDFISKWFFENAARLYQNAESKTQTLLKLSSSLGRLALSIFNISDSDNLVYNARKIFVYAQVKQEWPVIYNSYVAFIGNGKESLQEEELICLAAKWNVELDVYTEDGILFNGGRKLDNPEVVVCIISEGGQWKALSDIPRNTNINETVRANNTELALNHETASLLIIRDMLQALVTKQKPQLATTQSRLEFRTLHAIREVNMRNLTLLPGLTPAAIVADISLFSIGYMGLVPESYMLFSAIRAGSIASSFWEAFSLTSIFSRLLNPYFIIPMIALQGGLFWLSKQFEYFILNIKSVLSIYEDAIKK